MKPEKAVQKEASGSQGDKCCISSSFSFIGQARRGTWGEKEKSLWTGVSRTQVFWRGTRQGPNWVIVSACVHACVYACVCVV